MEALLTWDKFKANPEINNSREMAKRECKLQAADLLSKWEKQRDHIFKMVSFVGECEVGEVGEGGEGRRNRNRGVWVCIYRSVLGRRFQGRRGGRVGRTFPN